MKTKHSKLNIMALSIMFLLLSFCLCGCASVNFVTYHNDNGTISEYVHLNIDKQAIISCGYDFNIVQFEIKTNSYNEAQNLILEYQHKLANEYQTT